MSSNILLFGPPGAGKGTQSALLVQELGMAHVSTGDILREAIKRGTDLGKKAKGYMDAGQLVPDELIIGLVENVLKNLQGKNFILDGFPRNVPQAEALEVMLKKNQWTLGKAIFLEVPRSELVERLCGRRVCKNCGAVYHVTAKPTRVPGVCDVCGGEVVQRSDDKEDVVRARLEVYDQNTSPLKQYYQDKGVFVGIKGSGAVEEIFSQIKRVVKNSA